MSDAPVDTPAAEPTDAAPSTPSSGRRVAPFVAVAILLVIVGLVWMLAGADAGGTDEVVASPLIDQPAPVVQSTTLDGGSFDLSRRKGSWVVLNFFNSTCVPCIREHPELVAFHEQQQALGADGAELYTVVNDDSDAAVRAFFDENGGGWPIVRDDDGRIAVAFGVARVPETWIVRPDGVVVARFAGEVTADGLSTIINQLRLQAGG